ncbi:DNA-directed RNA polymerases I, II, and III subunit RPABC5-like [Hippopotamus amphibius kiboko]|uniref:DNA-directed RNA polymerases I, II, and III subunit RPABC5-like n=1 Tax=Hippopotamus amphibius kiboko TaxID=575201 RepID=UPI002592D409|nr:DNA-directed RNA polymerases I, II, and III subunit RPABC5-like [Hippopotamus amphibius kiboko]
MGGQPAGPASCCAVAIIIPVHCFTSSKIIGNTWGVCLGLLQAEYTQEDALDGLQRSMLLAHVDLTEKLLNYAPLGK